MDDRKILKLKEMIEQLHQDGVDHLDFCTYLSIKS